MTSGRYVKLLDFDSYFRFLYTFTADLLDENLSMKPAQERREIGQQLRRFTVLKWSCVQEVKRQVVP